MQNACLCLQTYPVQRAKSPCASHVHPRRMSEVCMSRFATAQGMLMASSQPATAAALEEQLRGWEADVARLEGAAQQVGRTAVMSRPTRRRRAGMLLLITHATAE